VPHRHYSSSTSSGGKRHWGLGSTSRQSSPGRHAEEGSLAKPRKTPLTTQQYQQPLILIARTFMYMILECFRFLPAKHEHCNSSPPGQWARQEVLGEKSKRNGHWALRSSIFSSSQRSLERKETGTKRESSTALWWLKMLTSTQEITHKTMAACHALC